MGVPAAKHLATHFGTLVNGRSILLFTNRLPSTFGSTCPFQPLIIRTNARKGLGSVRVSHFGVSLPNTFSLSNNKRLCGLVSDIAHSTTVSLGVQAKGLGFLATLTSVGPKTPLIVPSDVLLSTHLNVRKPRCSTHLRLGRGRNELGLATGLGAGARMCDTSLGVRSLRIGRFLPRSSVCRLAASLSTHKHKLSFASCHSITAIGTSVSGLRCTSCQVSNVRLSKTIGGTITATRLADSGTLLGVGTSTRCRLTRHCPSKGMRLSIASLSARGLINIDLKGRGMLTFRFAKRIHGRHMFARLASNSLGLGLDTHTKLRPLVHRSARFTSVLVERLSGGRLGRTRLHGTLPATVFSFSTKHGGPVT